MGKPIDVSKEPVDLKAFLADLMPILSSEVSGTGIQIITDIRQVPPVSVDEGQLTQVLLNIVRNAVEILSEKGKITVGLDTYKNQWVKITVRDSGPGVSGDAERLFKPFYTTKAGGTGLGLAISRAIINNHGGQIDVKNHPEGGAVFSIVLPLPVQERATRSKIEVLYISNEELERLPVEQVLRSAGFKVLSVCNVDNALFMSNRFTPAVIIMETGFLDERVYKNVKRVFPNAKILVVGDCKVLNEEKDIYSLPKPFNYAQLVNKIEIIYSKSIED